MRVKLLQQKFHINYQQIPRNPVHIPYYVQSPNLIEVISIPMDPLADHRRQQLKPLQSSPLIQLASQSYWIFINDRIIFSRSQLAEIWHAREQFLCFTIFLLFRYFLRDRVADFQNIRTFSTKNRLL